MLAQVWVSRPDFTVRASDSALLCLHLAHTSWILYPSLERTAWGCFIQKWTVLYGKEKQNVGQNGFLFLLPDNLIISVCPSQRAGSSLICLHISVCRTDNLCRTEGPPRRISSGVNVNIQGGSSFFLNLTIIDILALSRIFIMFKFMTETRKLFSSLMVGTLSQNRHSVKYSVFLAMIVWQNNPDQPCRTVWPPSKVDSVAQHTLRLVRVHY